MSYRMHLKIDDREIQIFGNNECPTSVMEFLKKSGCSPDGDECFYDFKITDLDGLIKSTEKYIKELYNKNKSRNYNMGNFTKELDFAIENASNFTQSMKDIVNRGYIFASINILLFIGEENYTVEVDGRNFVYKLKEGKHLYMSGY